MTQGNRCRMAVGTRPGSAARGCTRPPPRPTSHLLPGSRPPASPVSPTTLPLPPARVPSEKPLPRERGGARGGGGRGPGRGRARGRQGAGRLSLGPPRPWGAPGPPPARGWSFVLSLPTTCLSRGPEGPQRKGRCSRRGFPSTPEGSARVSLPPCLPASPLLSSSFVASTPGHDTAWAVSLLPLGSWQCGRTANTVSCPPAKSGRAERSRPRRAARPAGLVAAAVRCPRAPAPPGFCGRSPGLGQLGLIGD